MVLKRTTKALIPVTMAEYMSLDLKAMNDSPSISPATPKPRQKSVATAAVADMRVRLPINNSVIVKGTVSINASSSPPFKAMERKSFDREIGRLSM